VSSRVPNLDSNNNQVSNDLAGALFQLRDSMLEMAEALREIQLSMPSTERNKAIAEAENYLAKLKETAK
jgi:hypothetical protein